MFIVCVVLFFFFKQKTAYELRISDWSSDVCSSDLSPAFRRMIAPGTARRCQAASGAATTWLWYRDDGSCGAIAPNKGGREAPPRLPAGIPSTDRKSVV